MHVLSLPVRIIAFVKSSAVLVELVREDQFVLALVVAEAFGACVSILRSVWVDQVSVWLGPFDLACRVELCVLSVWRVRDWLKLVVDRVAGAKLSEQSIFKPGKSPTKASGGLL